VTKGEKLRLYEESLEQAYRILSGNIAVMSECFMRLSIDNMPDNICDHLQDSGWWLGWYPSMLNLSIPKVAPKSLSKQRNPEDKSGKP
jgi:hypothetical protein